MLKAFKSNQVDEEFINLLKKLDMEAQTQSLGFLDWEVPSGIATWDKTWSDLFNLPQGKHYGNSKVWEEAIFSDDHPVVMGKLNDHLNGKTPHFMAEYRPAHGQGSEYSIRTCGVAIARNSKDFPTRVVMFSQKISQMSD